MSALGTDVPVLSCKEGLDWMESNDLLEEIEHLVAVCGVREVCKGSVAAADVS